MALVGPPVLRDIWQFNKLALLTFALGGITTLSVFLMSFPPHPPRVVVQQRPMPTCQIPFQMTSGTLRLLVPCDLVPDADPRKANREEPRPLPAKDQSRLPQERVVETSIKRRKEQ